MISFHSQSFEKTTFKCNKRIQNIILQCVKYTLKCLLIKIKEEMIIYLCTYTYIVICYTYNEYLHNFFFYVHRII